ncbi:hypothetical protein AQJ67_24460 [Streptomyces caeruleatus]|uniref:Uncharacterized protein n=1 Tax=Streptomyces caeruleatus TaxID=661399 RepID=A0A101TX21_9ACTN|nr:hypothetical protein AQJ67_24460 [Streptomyces caeruleatus]
MTVATLIRRISKRPWPVPLTRPCRGISAHGRDLSCLLRLVALDDHGVVGLAAEKVVGVLALGVHGVAGDDHSGQVGHGLQRELEAGDFVRLFLHVQLGQDQAGSVVQGCEQVDLTAVGPGRSAKVLTVDRQAAEPAPGSVAAVGEPAADCQVQCVAVDPG